MITETLECKVSDIMNKDFIVLNLGHTLEYALNKMMKFYKDEVIIEDENGQLLGIFTRKDFGKLMDIQPFSLKDSIKDYISSKVITISAKTSVRNARNLMLQHNIGRLPVVENDKVIGVLTSNNIRDKFYLSIDHMYVLQNNIIDNMHEAVCISDAKGIVNYWNKSSEKLYNIKAKDIIGRYIGEIFPNAMITKVLKHGRYVQNMKHEPVKGKLVILSVVPIYNSNGELITIVSTDRDITEVVNLSEQLTYEKKKVELLKDAYQREIATNYNFSSITGKNKKIMEIIAICQKVASTTASILITGESGTGKEVFAKAIHEASGRQGPFVAVNCSSIPVQLLESELFGYIEGAFTGASKKGKIGKFELANNGTLFLDEIGDMPFEMQAKLLRVLQDGMICRLGGEKEIITNTRIIAATNKNLKELIKQNLFREDLFYRISVVQLELPPLRERKEDIKELINLFINQVSKKENIDINLVEENIYKTLINYKWEGNIRELRNVIQKMVILSNDGVISEESIPQYMRDYSVKDFENSEGSYDLRTSIEKLEKRMIMEAMNLAGGNKQKAAQTLNIKRSTLYYKLAQYNL